MFDCDLWKATQVKDIDQVRLLLQSRKCSPERDSLTRQQPLILECFASGDDGGEEEDYQTCELLKLLVQHGWADVNAQTEVEEFCDLAMPCKTAAMFAAERGYVRCLQFLHESGADLNVTCPWGETALTFAVKKTQVRCVKYLSEHMSPSALNLVLEEEGTALMLAMMTPGKQGLASAQHLLTAGAQLDLQDSVGNTALAYAFRYKFSEAVKLLLDRGAYINTINESGFSPLTMAFCRMNFNCNSIVRLLQLGAQPMLSRRDLGNVHKSVAWGQKALVRGLLMSGCPALDLACHDLLHPLPRGSQWPPRISPLALAFLCKRLDIARYFIVNRFFTRFDILQLCWNDSIRKSLQRVMSSFRYDKYSVQKETERRQWIEILDFLSSRPHSLLNLCLVAVSSALSQSIVQENSDGQMYGREYWICRPTFTEKVEQLQLPLILKRALLFDIAPSAICCQQWKDIPLGGEGQFLSCHSCQDCQGENIEASS